MPKFVINKGFGNETTVESDGWIVRDGYFQFISGSSMDPKQVYAIRDEKVVTVELATE